MENPDLHQLFLDELADMHQSEHQILASLPKLIKICSLPELSETMTKHLQEMQNQIKRTEQIFSLLGEKPKQEKCDAMEGLLREAEHLTQNKGKSPTLDVAIISAAQKVAHYGIASYGTLHSLAKNLHLDSKIIDLIQDNLDAEQAIDKKLTKIADGSWFSSGVNKEAAEESLAGGRRGKR